METKTICVCTPIVPFIRGGNETFVETLNEKLNEYGHNSTLITLPYKWYPNEENLKNCISWRLLDLSEYDGNRIDAVVGTKFPSYFVKHTNKITWLTHQFREIYDLYNTKYSLFRNNPKDNDLRRILMKIDRNALNESKKIFTISENVANRLKKYSGLDGVPLYPPLKNEGRYYNDGYEDYILFVSRLDPKKRVVELVEAMKYTKSEAKCLIIGEGVLENKINKLAKRYDIESKIIVKGYVSDNALIDFYSKCFCVFFAPLDEDYGFVTVEAFRSQKPVITFKDSGGVLEFVRNEENGYIIDNNPREIAKKIDYLYENKDVCKEFGKKGYERVKSISWKNALKTFLGGI